MADRSKKAVEKKSSTSSPPPSNLPLSATLTWGTRINLRPRGGGAGGGGGSSRADGPPRPPSTNRRSPVGPFEPINEKGNKGQVSGGTSSGSGGVEADGKKQSFRDDGVKKKAKEELNAPRRWNFRSRSSGSGSGSGASSGLSPPKKLDEEEVIKGGGSRHRGAPTPWPKFTQTLTKEEIEADFLAMTGAKPPKKPMKRPKPVQKQLDFLTPGSSLKYVKPGCYDVRDGGD